MRIKTPPITAYPLTGAALILVLLVVGTWMLTASKRDQLQKLRDKYQSLTDTASWTAPRDIQDQIARAEAAVKQIHTDNDISDLLSALGRDLEDNQTTDRQLTTGRASGDGIQQIPIQIRYSGDFAATCRLLDRLTHYPTLIRVDQMRLQRATDDATSKLDVELNLSTFVGDLKRGKS